MEVLLQFILEPLFFVYFDLAEEIIGDKQLKKWQEYFLKILCLIVSFVAIFLTIIGIFWVMDVEPFKTYGTVMLIVGISVLLVHFFIGLFVGGNHFIEEKRKEESSDYQHFEEKEAESEIYYIKTNTIEENDFDGI